MKEIIVESTQYKSTDFKSETSSKSMFSENINKAIIDIRLHPRCAIPPTLSWSIGHIACARKFSEYYLCLPGIMNAPFCCMTLTLLAIEWSLLQLLWLWHCSKRCSKDCQCSWMTQTWWRIRQIAYCQLEVKSSRVGNPRFGVSVNCPVTIHDASFYNSCNSCNASWIIGMLNPKCYLQNTTWSKCLPLPVFRHHASPWSAILVSFYIV